MSKANALVRFIAKEFLHDEQQTDIPENLDLIATGVVDSLGLLRIVAFVEEHFQVAIEPEAMVPANFRSIASILATLAAQHKAA
jgi:acyl carrier protein